MFLSQFILLFPRKLAQVIPLPGRTLPILPGAADPHVGGSDCTNCLERDAGHYPRYVLRRVFLRERDGRDDATELAQRAREGGHRPPLGMVDNLVYADNEISQWELFSFLFLFPFLCEQAWRLRKRDMLTTKLLRAADRYRFRSPRDRSRYTASRCARTPRGTCPRSSAQSRRDRRRRGAGSGPTGCHR